MKKMNTVTTDVKFGQPSRNCLNFGICQMSLYMQGQPYRTTKDAIALLVYSNKVLSISFLKKTMNNRAINKYFNNAEFIVLEDFNLPLSVCKALGIPSFIIPKGTYNTAESALGYQLSIQKEIGMSM